MHQLIFQHRSECRLNRAAFVENSLMHFCGGYNRPFNYSRPVSARSSHSQGSWRVNHVTDRTMDISGGTMDIQERYTKTVPLIFSLFTSNFTSRRPLHPLDWHSCSGNWQVDEEGDMYMELDAARSQNCNHKELLTLKLIHRIWFVLGK